MSPTLPILRLLILTVALAAAGAGSGCGYSNGGDGYQWETLYPEDVQTVAVPIFKNTAFQRGVEFTLTKAVISHLEASTPYKVVPRERADTILEGEIVDVRVDTLSTDRRSAVPQEQLLDIMVDFTWKDLRTGRILVQRRGVEQAVSYYPTLGEGRTTGAQAAVERLAVAIVQELQGDW